MIPQPPPGQGPIDPRGAFQPPTPPGQAARGGNGGAPVPPVPGPVGAPPGVPPNLVPPMMYPPMMPPPMYYPPPRRSRLGLAFTVLLSVLLLVSVMLNLFSVAAGLMGSDELVIERNVLVEGDARSKIAVVPVTGIIETGLAERVDRFLRQIEKDSTVKAVVLQIDTPGGGVTASDDIHARVLRFKQATGRPVVAVMGDLATSGGYYVACAADHIVAQPTTITGNIGVLLPRYNLSELAAEWGIKETTTVSTGAPFKNVGSMFQPETPEHAAYLQELADEMFARFKDVVDKGRQGKLTTPIDAIANGKAYVAREAKDLGLVDQVGYAADAYQHAATLASVSGAQVVRYEDPPTLLDLLSIRSPLGGGVEGAGRDGGVRVSLDRATLHELASPRLLYLWRGE